MNDMVVKLFLKKAGTLRNEYLSVSGLHGKVLLVRGAAGTASMIRQQRVFPRPTGPRVSSNRP